MSNETPSIVSFTKFSPVSDTYLFLPEEILYSPHPIIIDGYRFGDRGKGELNYLLRSGRVLKPGYTIKHGNCDAGADWFWVFMIAGFLLTGFGPMLYDLVTGNTSGPITTLNAWQIIGIFGGTVAIGALVSWGIGRKYGEKEVHLRTGTVTNKVILKVRRNVVALYRTVGYDSNFELLLHSSTYSSTDQHQYASTLIKYRHLVEKYKGTKLTRLPEYSDETLSEVGGAARPFTVARRVARRGPVPGSPRRALSSPGAVSGPLGAGSPSGGSVAEGDGRDGGFGGSRAARVSTTDTRRSEVGERSGKVPHNTHRAARVSTTDTRRVEASKVTHNTHRASSPAVQHLGPAKKGTGRRARRP